MKEKILKTIYRYDENNKIYHIDIQLDGYRDVYSNWDYSPFVNRDLDEDLLEYMMSCSYEIPKKREFVIDFFLLSSLYDVKREERSIEGIHNYFGYKIRQTQSERFRLMRSTVLFSTIGTLLLISAVFSNKVIQAPFFERIISEGLFIGAWVAIWEIFSIWFFKINALRCKIKQYKKLQKSKIYYHYKD
ncbi:MAG: hypothetical protein CVV02_05245 [Firmicutes bacterium HGW-Firmicutes-7]|nr:MAG: hypothetical protein CVV02_05245 [Firmicutes bacterium HGW-Firmicutes-7]